MENCKYKVYCETDNRWEEFETLYPQEICPVDKNHTVRNGSLVCIGDSTKTYNEMRSEFMAYISIVGDGDIESGFVNATDIEKDLCCEHQIGTCDQRMIHCGVDDMLVYNDAFINVYDDDIIHHVSHIKHNGTNGTATNDIISINGYNLLPDTNIHISNVPEIHSLDGLYSLLMNTIAGNVVCYDMGLKKVDNDFIITFYNIYSKYLYNRDGLKFYKIYYLMNSDLYQSVTSLEVSPKSLDYKKGLYKRLIPKNTFDAGFLIESEYYENIIVTKDIFGLEDTIYNNPILKVNFQYHFGEDGYVSHRHVKRSWCLINGVYSDDFKSSIKYYDKQNARTEGIVRRTNIVDRLVIDTGGLIIMFDPDTFTVAEAQAKSLPLLHDMNLEINNYKQGDTMPLIERLQIYQLPDVESSSNDNWLEIEIPGTGGVTIRMYLINSLMGALIEDVNVVFGDIGLYSDF